MIKFAANIKSIWTVEKITILKVRKTQTTTTTITTIENKQTKAPTPINHHQINRKSRYKLLRRDLILLLTSSSSNNIKSSFRRMLRACLRSKLRRRKSKKKLTQIKISHSSRIKMQWQMVRVMLTKDRDKVRVEEEGIIIEVVRSSRRLQHHQFLIHLSTILNNHMRGKMLIS